MGFRLICACSRLWAGLVLLTMDNTSVRMHYLSVCAYIRAQSLCAARTIRQSWLGKGETSSQAGNGAHNHSQEEDPRHHHIQVWNGSRGDVSGRLHSHGESRVWPRETKNSLGFEFPTHTRPQRLLRTKY